MIPNAPESRKEERTRRQEFDRQQAAAFPIVNVKFLPVLEATAGDAETTAPSIFLKTAPMTGTGGRK